MKTSRYIPAVSALVALAALSVRTLPLCAQANSDIPILVADHGDGSAPGIDTLRFGINSAASNGRDAGLGEEEQPPAPPEGVFDVRWVNVGSTKDFGQGVKRNYHAAVSTEQSDTFRFKVQPGFKPGTGGYPVTLTWPNLAKSFTAAQLRFVDGDGNPATFDMMSGNTYSFSNPSSVTSTVTITTTGPKAAGVGTAQDATLDLRLASAPNPVHRADGAELNYRLPFRAHVTVRLYNSLGEAVATPVDGDQAPMQYSLRLETKSLPAGSYFCTITAGRLTMTCPIMLVD